MNFLLELVNSLNENKANVLKENNVEIDKAYFKIPYAAES